MQQDPAKFKPRTLQRVAAVLELCGAKRGRLLSVGAGSLVEPQAFQEAGFAVTAIDVASSLMEAAREVGIEGRVVNLDADVIPGKYDVVCCLEVLEHLLDPLTGLAKAAAAVCNGGKLFVSLPEEFHLLARFQVLFGRPPFNHYNWHHIRFFNLRAARELFDAAGLRIVRTRHMPLVPPQWRWLQGPGRVLANLMPSLFSLSHLFELAPKTDRQADE